jgi:hypothetical protein
MHHIHALPVAHLPVALQIMYEEISEVVACKPMWQNLRAYQTITNNPCPHINAELLLVSIQYSSTINHNLHASGHVLIGYFFLFWYVELVLKVCPHLSVTLTYRWMSFQKQIFYCIQGR